MAGHTSAIQAKQHTWKIIAPSCNRTGRTVAALLSYSPANLGWSVHILVLSKANLHVPTCASLLFSRANFSTICLLSYSDVRCW
jgi:hypothetical protein